jgi:large subunit ribosomal protein L1
MAKKKDVMPKDAEKAEIVSDEIDKTLSDQESETDQEIDLESAEAEVGASEQVASEVSAINTDNETAKEQNKKPKKVSKKTKTVKPKTKSKAYLKSIDGFEGGKSYKIEEAIELVKKHSYSKFDGTLSLAIKLQKSKKGDDAVRGTIKLPNGAGRELKVAIADEKLIEEIKKGKADFDILVATPSMMPKLGAVAKILGPKGKMPNPKDGTVVEDPKAVSEDLGKNVVRYRQDIGGNLHLPVGKVSFEAAKIAENIQAVLKSLAHLKKESVTLSPTMGPGIKIEL